MSLRLKLMLWLYGWSQIFYAKYFKRKKQPWNLTKNYFNNFPENSLGNALGKFYQKNGFDVMPKLENHDVFHVLTDTDTEIQDEIAMQYLLCGNGKRSSYMVSMMVIGTILFPEFFVYYKRYFQKGKAMKKFHKEEFKFYLNENLDMLRNQFK